MNNLKRCVKCGKEYPNTTEYFIRNGYKRNGNQRFSLSCKFCQKEYRVKVKDMVTDPAVAQMMADILDVEKIKPVKCSGGSASLKEYGVCIHVGCRYHMIDMIRNNSINGAMSVDQVVDRLMDMKYTCLWDLMEKEKSPLSQVEIANILGVTNERVRQIEEEGLASMRRKGGYLEIFLEDDVDLRYKKPERVIGTGRISEKSICPTWSKNFEHSVPVGEQ